MARSVAANAGALDRQFRRRLCSARYQPERKPQFAFAIKGLEICKACSQVGAIIARNRKKGKRRWTANDPWSGRL